MNSHDQGWQRLVTAARGYRDDRDETAPYGFATRVAARAMVEPRKPALATLFERFSWRALGVAGLLAAVSAASTYASATAQAEDEGYLDDSAEVLVLGLSGS
jgi:hypothetical protein